VTIPRRLRRGLAALTLPLLAGCDRQFSVVSPVGPQARRISDLTWFLTWTGTAVFLVVMAFLGYALWRGHHRIENATGPQVERRLVRWVGGAVAVTLLILLTVLVYSFYTGRELARFAEPGALTIRVTGRQWWWRVQYLDPVNSQRFETANEIHIPVGRRVRLEVQSQDVIHSFWVPNLHGKVDVIPGYTATTYFRADREGSITAAAPSSAGLSTRTWTSW
jgi:cytochrome c oxidase subunit II